MLMILHMSSAKIEGEIPTWFWNFSSDLTTINLSHNQLRGGIQNISIPIPKENIGFQLYLGSNQFSGPLPHIPVNLTELDLSENSFSGDVSHFLCHTQNVPYELQFKYSFWEEICYLEKSPIVGCTGHS